MPTNYTRDVFAATLDEAIKASGMNQKDIADALDDLLIEAEAEQPEKSQVLGRT